MDLPNESLRELGQIMREAAALALDVRRTMTVELKPDGSLVTDADRSVEELLRDRLAKSWPKTKFWGEEFGRDETAGESIWLIDPIDGTSNFAYGSPLWGISVALAVGDEIELGAIWLPDLSEEFLAAKGQGAYGNGIRLAPIPPGGIQMHELISCNERILLNNPGRRIPGKIRCAGAFVIDGAFVARQRYRAMMALDEYLYDAAAAILINQELGAEIRWADGRELPMSELIQGRKFDETWAILPRNAGFFPDVSVE